MEVKFNVRRYDPESTDAVDHFQEYLMDMDDSSTVLDGLIRGKSRGCLTYQKE